MKGILGRKVGMTQVFSPTGELTPVTVVEVTPNIITQIKTSETDGYNAIQLGVEDKRDKLVNKPQAGHFKKANTQGKRFVKEIRLTEDEVAAYELGQTLDVSLFEAGEFVDVQGTSKGKGFQGAIKRHGQSIGPKGHGSRYHRRPGSMGAVAPAVFKGKNLPGHMGDKTVTIQGLEIVAVDTDNNALLIKGNVPGAKKSFVTIKASIKKTNKKDAIELVKYEKETAEDAE
jgi:large subunit ribosomal protein L3